LTDGGIFSGPAKDSGGKGPCIACAFRIISTSGIAVSFENPTTFLQCSNDGRVRASQGDLRVGVSTDQTVLRLATIRHYLGPAHK
jgi:hypothetical protein